MKRSRLLIIGLLGAAIGLCAAGEQSNNVQQTEAAAVTSRQAGATTNAVKKTILKTDAVEKTVEQVGQRTHEMVVSVKGRLPKWMQNEMMGVGIGDYVIVFILILAGYVLKRTSDYILNQKIIPLCKRRGMTFNLMMIEAAAKPIGYGVFLVFLTIVMVILVYSDPPTGLWIFTKKAIGLAYATLLFWFMCRIVDLFTNYLIRQAKRTNGRLDDQLAPLISKALKVTIGIIYILWIIQAFGGNISALLAGLGIGGLAVALALQDTLANLFGSIFIILDRPFRVGDRIVLENTDGIVEEVGLRSTRIRTLDKTLVAIPNKTVANTKIDNITAMPMRKVVQTIGVTYETSADSMEKARDAIRGILDKDEDIDKEFIVVRFTEFGDSSLNILVIYFTKTADYQEFLKVKERVNLGIMRELEALGLSIAFPTRTVYFEGDIASKLAEKNT